MSSPDSPAGAELDVRATPKPERHPLIFARFTDLAVGEAFVLVNDHDPVNLRAQFQDELPGSYGWQVESAEPGSWRVRITKLTSTPLPRVLVDTTEASADVGEPDVSGAVWKLQARERDLDSNIIALPPDGAIDAHTGPDLDVLIHVLAGHGRLITEAGEVELAPGALLWLPRRSQRQFTAGPAGLRYLTVHQRRTALRLGPTRTRAR